VLVGLDAYLTPVSDAVLNGGLPQPALLLFSERWPNEKNNALLGRLLMVSAHMERASILGTAHYDFSDLPLLSPLAQFLGLKGPLKAETALAITREAALVVFDAVLRNGAPAALHALTDTYPELKFDLVP
jgi:hypothetical protein